MIHIHVELLQRKTENYEYERIVTLFFSKSKTHVHINQICPHVCLMMRVRAALYIGIQFFLKNPDISQ